MNVLTNLTVEIISQYIHVSNHHVMWQLYLNRAEKSKNYLSLNYNNPYMVYSTATCNPNISPFFSLLNNRIRFYLKQQCAQLKDYPASLVYLTSMDMFMWLVSTPEMEAKVLYSAFRNISWERAA